MIKDTAKVFIPSNGTLIELTREESKKPDEIQKRFLSEGLIAWIIYTRGD